MSNDSKLLELAAKAAGYRLDGPAHKHIAQGVGPLDLLRLNEQGGHSVWNPLTDDGDAFRLTVKLRFEISPLEGGGVDVAWYDHDDRMVLAAETGSDCAATRRAIVRAAADIGSQP